jgi:hypothetical protein
MPTIEVSEETYRKLEQRARRQETSIEALVGPTLESISGVVFPPVPTLEEFRKGMEEIAERARARAHLYPPGFEADVSRESMYEGCGE